MQVNKTVDKDRPAYGRVLTKNVDVLGSESFQRNHPGKRAQVGPTQEHPPGREPRGSLSGPWTEARTTALGRPREAFSGPIISTP